MGHLTHPTRYRYGKAIYWANNWPAKERNRFMQLYGLQKELNQFFRSLFFYSRPRRVIYKRNHTVYSRERRPNIFFSHVNLNIFGFNLDKVVLDVNIFDYFLESQIDKHLTNFNRNYSKFFKKFKSFFSLDFFLRNKKVFKRLKPSRYNTLINFRRNRYNFIENIFREKAKVFFEFYCQLIQRAFFSFFADKKKFFNKKYLLGGERRMLQSLPFKYRAFAIQKYWNIKYQNIQDNYAFTFNEFFSQYYSGHFKHYTEKYTKDYRGRIRRRYQTNPDIEFIPKRQIQVKKKKLYNSFRLFMIKTNKKQRTKNKSYNPIFTLDNFKVFIKQEYLKNPHDQLITSLYNTVIEQQTFNKKDLFPLREFLDSHIKKNLLYQTTKAHLVQQKKFNSFLEDKEKKIQILGRNKYIRIYNANKKIKAKEKKDTLKVEQKHLQENFENFNEIENHFTFIPVNTVLRRKKKTQKNLNLINYIEKTFNKYSELKKISEKEFLNLESKFYNLNLLYTNFATELNTLNTEEKETINIENLLKKKKKILMQQSITLNKDIHKNITKFLKRKSKNWYKYKLDPFYQKYLKLKKIKTLILNINVGLGEPSDHLDAHFLALYVKKLFVRKKPLWEIYRTMYRTLSKVDYLDGFLITFAGRFTRSQYATYQLKKKGILSFGNTSKLIDYHTIGFVGKFGYCGIKVYLQYKSKLPHYKNKNIQTKTAKQEQFEAPKKFNYTIEPYTNQKILQKDIVLKDPSTKLKRILQKTITKSNVSYYNNDNFLIK